MSSNPTPQSPTPPPPPPPHKPILLHLGADIRWNTTLYTQHLAQRFQIVRSHSLERAAFQQALRDKTWGDFVAVYRPFWNTGGEMGAWDEEMIALLPPSCKIYASAGAGFDWVDTRALARRGIIYCNAAAACTESVADMALVLILSCYRGIPWSFAAARSGSAAEFADAHHHVAAVSHNPRGTVLGVVGLGRIGQRVAEKAARGLDMQIAYFDIVRREEGEKAVGARWCETLEELLRTSDCVVLAAPFEGEVMFSHKEFAQMKRGARLVNVARGKLVDEEALNKALDEGTVSAAGLDVHANEPVVDARLAQRDNVMVLCHTAGASVESHVGFERLGMENILGWLEKGEEGVVSAVNLQWLKRE